MNDVIIADCSCAGTFADADNDGTCDTNDLCAGPEAGSACDDNDACTVNDVILADCSCAGTFADADNDGTCDANDLCIGAEPGTSCNDENPCTINDMITSDCACVGTAVDPQFSSESVHACGPYTWNNTTYNESGTYEVTLHNAAGCDSIAQLILTIGTPTFTNESVNACDSYAWNGTTYTQSGTYTYVTTNNTGCPNTATLNLTVNPTRTPLFNAVGPYCSGASIPALPTTSTNGIQGAWSPAINNTATTTYTFTPSAGQCATTTSLTITINTNSTAPSSATASSTNVAANTTVALTVNGGALGTGAQWKWYSTSCGGTSVGTGASIAVNVGTTTTYFVRAEGTCNTTSCASVTVNVQTVSCGPLNVTATATTICSGSSTTLSVQGNTGTGGSWKWYKNACGSGTCAYTGATYTVSPTTTTTYFVRAEGGICGTTACMSITITVNPLPTKPASISGPVSGLCGMQNVMYSTSACSGATAYQWTVPSGVTIVSGQGTTTLTVNFSNSIGNNSSCGSASICVRAGNSCGWSAYQCNSLQLTPAAPGSISGSSTPCRSQPVVYSITSVVGATSYQWTVPSGYTIQSGQGTTSITLIPGNTGGSIGVRAINGCGSSSMSSRSVSPKKCTRSMPMEMELWPNPTNSLVFFGYDEIQPERLDIYDIMGKTIYTGPWIEEFNVTGLESGIYFVRATSGEESVVKRMEVVR